MANSTIITVLVVCFVVVAALTTTLILTLHDDEPKNNGDDSILQGEVFLSASGEAEIIRRQEVVLKGNLGTLFDSDAVDCEPSHDDKTCLEWPGKAILEVAISYLKPGGAPPYLNYDIYFVC